MLKNHHFTKYFYSLLIFHHPFQTWHDLRSKTKKKQTETNGEIPFSTTTLTQAEQDALGIKTLSSDDYQESAEFVPLSENQDEFNDAMSATSLSEPGSPPEPKVFVSTEHKTKKVKIKNSKRSSKHSNSCFFNCDLIAVQEQRKAQIKEDYLNFKKDYLRQKLKLLKEQTEALKSIAKELTK